MREAVRIRPLDQAVGGSVRGVRIERGCGQERRALDKLTPPIEPHLVEVAHGPEWQFAETGKLRPVVRRPELRGLDALAGFLQLDKGPSRAVRLREGDIGPADAADPILRQHLRRRRAAGEHRFEQGLKPRRQEQLERRAIAADARVGPSRGPDFPRVIPQQLTMHCGIVCHGKATGNPRAARLLTSAKPLDT
jgi:hypothetical protein